jgi:hypothetical protein
LAEVHAFAVNFQSDVDAVVDDEGDVASFASSVESPGCVDEVPGVAGFVAVLDDCGSWGELVGI